MNTQGIGARSATLSAAQVEALRTHLAREVGSTPAVGHCALELAQSGAPVAEWLATQALDIQEKVGRGLVRTQVRMSEVQGPMLWGPDFATALGICRWPPAVLDGYAYELRALAMERGHIALGASVSAVVSAAAWGLTGDGLIAQACFGAIVASFVGMTTAMKIHFSKDED